MSDKNTETIMENNINMVSEHDVPGTKQHMAEIRFDCVIRMFDCGLRQTPSGLLHDSEQLPPQWFKSENTVTLNMIKYADPCTLGNIFKNMLRQLEDHIKKYER